MSSIKKILVPVDFSNHSQKALDQAVELARTFGASIDILHCYAINAGGISPYGMVLSDDFSREFREAAQAKLTEWTEKIAAEGVEVDAILTSRFPSEAIADTAKEKGSDLIVMGTRGLTGLSHIVLGSVAERTIRIAPCAVLTVKVDDAG